MDEIRAFEALLPEPPADAQAMTERARARLLDALAAASQAGSLRARRDGRRRLAVRSAAVIAAAAAAAVTVPTLLPGGTGAIVTPAWAVTKSGHGTIIVTFRRALRDPAGLQRALRADGVRAYVRSLDRLDYCLPRAGIRQIRQYDNLAERIMTQRPDADGDFAVLVIHRALLPRGLAIFIGGVSDSNRSGFAAQLFVMDDQPPVCVAGTYGRRIPRARSARHRGAPGSAALIRTAPLT
jgi:hypothetical protein